MTKSPYLGKFIDEFINKYLNSISKLKKSKSELKKSLTNKLREKAIEQVKYNIAVEGKKPEDYDEEQRERMVAIEEKKIVDNIRKMSFKSVLIFLGFSFLP